MTTLDDWKALQRDVDAATGPTGELESKVRRLCGQAVEIHSLDAVTALIEREMPEVGWSVYSQPGRRYAGIVWIPHRGAPEYEVRDKKAPALALLSAFIRARIAELEQAEAAA